MASLYARDIEEIKAALAGIVPQVECIPALKESMSAMRAEMAGMASTVKTLHESCPYKVDIARGTNNVARVGKLEEEVKSLSDKQHGDRLVTAKSLAKIALVVAAAGMAGANVNLNGLLNLFN